MKNRIKHYKNYEKLSKKFAKDFFVSNKILNCKNVTKNIKLFTVSVDWTYSTPQVQLDHGQVWEQVLDPDWTCSRQHTCKL